MCCTSRAASSNRNGCTPWWQHTNSKGRRHHGQRSLTPSSQWTTSLVPIVSTALVEVNRGPLRFHDEMTAMATPEHEGTRYQSVLFLIQPQTSLGNERGKKQSEGFWCLRNALRYVRAREEKEKERNKGRLPDPPHTSISVTDFCSLPGSPDTWRRLGRFTSNASISPVAFCSL